MRNLLLRKTTDTVTLIDPDLVSVVGSVKTAKPTESKDQKKTKKSAIPSKSTYKRDIKELNAKWPERFSQLEALLIARTLEKPAVTEPAFLSDHGCCYTAFHPTGYSYRPDWYSPDSCKAEANSIYIYSHIVTLM